MSVGWSFCIAGVCTCVCVLRFQTTPCSQIQPHGLSSCESVCKKETRTPETSPSCLTHPFMSWIQLLSLQLSSQQHWCYLFIYFVAYSAFFVCASPCLPKSGRDWAAGSSCPWIYQEIELYAVTVMFALASSLSCSFWHCFLFFPGYGWYQWSDIFSSAICSDARYFPEELLFLFISCISTGCGFTEGSPFWSHTKFLK